MRAQGCEHQGKTGKKVIRHGEGSRMRRAWINGALLLAVVQSFIFCCPLFAVRVGPALGGNTLCVNDQLSRSFRKKIKLNLQGVQHSCKGAIRLLHHQHPDPHPRERHSARPFGVWRLFGHEACGERGGLDPGAPGRCLRVPALPLQARIPQEGSFHDTKLSVALLGQERRC